MNSFKTLRSSGNVDVAESAEDGEGVAGAGQQQPPLPQMPPQPAGGVQPGEMDVNVGGQANHHQVLAKKFQIYCAS